jgi:hypothetical protein
MMMHRIPEKIRASIRNDGYSATVRRVAHAIPARLATYRRRAKFRADFLVLETPEDRFTQIYKKNYWKGSDSNSGSGSSIEYTANLRSQLPKLFARYSIKSVLDAPCGDFNWMKEVVSATSINYVGADIVKPLIQQLNEKYSSKTVKFVHLDITEDALPQADLMICRDCLIHLSFADTRSMLVNFVSSGIPYLLTTTHTNVGAFQNHDIATGDYRLIDLYSAPYNFPHEPLAVIEDWVPPNPERTMCLWTRNQISAALGT